MHARSARLFAAAHAPVSSLPLAWSACQPVAGMSTLCFNEEAAPGVYLILSRQQFLMQRL